MRYDDEFRPRSISADSAMLQVNGSPLPCITLIRPMESEREVGRRCSAGGLCPHTAWKGQMQPAPCGSCTQVLAPCWGWLACIHAHESGARFGYYTGFIANVQEFSSAFMEDPEATLKRFFRYEGTSAVRAPLRASAKIVGNTNSDIFSNSESENSSENSD
jgi:hypothetical protein